MRIMFVIVTNTIHLPFNIENIFNDNIKKPNLIYYIR